VLKLNIKRSQVRCCKILFSNRIINEWNMLSEEIIAVNSLSGFKRKLDRHLRDVGGIYISLFVGGTVLFC